MNVGLPNLLRKNSGIKEELAALLGVIKEEITERIAVYPEVESVSL